MASASRNDPGPLSLVFVTTITVAGNALPTPINPLPSLVPAISSRVDAKSIPRLMNMFWRIVLFIKMFLVCFPFTEVLGEIPRDITQKVRIFLTRPAFDSRSRDYGVADLDRFEQKG